MHMSHKWTSTAAAAILCGALGISQPAAAQVYDNTSAARTISAGVNIPIRTSEAITSSAEDGRIFRGVVDQDVFDVNGRIAIPRGSTAELMVKRDSGDLAVDLESLTVNGERYAVDVDPTKTVGTSGTLGDRIENGAGSIGANKDTATYIGGGALLGTIVGAITGGGKGAAVGAAVGAAAGAGAQIYTHGKTINVPAESLVTFKLAQDLTLGVQDSGYTNNGFHYHRF
jgi:hypothetical protein